MSFCTIEYTTGYYDLIFYRMKMVQLDKDAEFGDVFDNCILCNEGNPPLLNDPKAIQELKCGDYVNLIPLDLIKILRSDRDDIEIEGFEKRKKETKFYPIKDFEIHGNELEPIGDYDESKATTRVDYYYIKKFC